MNAYEDCVKVGNVSTLTEISNVYVVQVSIPLLTKVGALIMMSAGKLECAPMANAPTWTEHSNATVYPGTSCLAPVYPALMLMSVLRTP